MSHLLFAVARNINGERNLTEIATIAGTELDRHLTAEDVAYLLDGKLRPAGLIAAAGEPALIKPADPPILGLRFRARVIPARFVRVASGLARPLFLPPIVVAVGLTLASTALHELGHATACRYGGARPGVIGVGVYLVWPVFYSDVTDSYRLGRAGRLRTDLGGVYFNVVSGALMAAAYLVTHFEPLLLAIVLVQMDALHQFFPFFRLDGYYVASDLIGVPDLFMRLRPMLASFIPGRPLHPQVRALKTWARYAVATWVFLTFAVIASLYVLLTLALPRVLATAWQSFMLHLAEIGYFAHHGSVGGVVLAVIDELMLAFPMLALAATSVYVGRRLLKLWTRLGEERPTKRMAVAIAATIILVLALPTITTPANFRPIQPSERGTLPSPNTVEHQLMPVIASPNPWPLPVTSPSPTSQSQAAPSPQAAPPSQPAPTPSPVSSSPSPEPSPSPSPEPSPSDSPTPDASPSPTDFPSPSPSPT